MKEYTMIEPVALSTISGEPVPDPRGGQARMSTKKLALMCVGSAEFTEGIEDTLEANELRAKVCGRVNDWSDVAGEKEYLEDDPAARVAKTVRKLNQPSIGHMLLPFQKALANPVDVEAAPVKETP